LSLHDALPICPPARRAVRRLTSAEGTRRRDDASRPCAPTSLPPLPVPSLRSRASRTGGVACSTPHSSRRFSTRASGEPGILTDNGETLSGGPGLAHDLKDVDTSWKADSVEPKLMLAGGEYPFEDVLDLAAEHVVDHGPHRLR